MTPDSQPIKAKEAEYKMGSWGESLLTDAAIETRIRGRVSSMLSEMDKLANKVSFNPFLEIGAGYIQRSAALMNNYPVDGVATDIMLQALQDAPYTLTLLDYERMPMLICCDAHYIPFLSNTFNFVCAFQMLHRFSDPAPAIAECYRILGKGGHFYFNEEPCDSGLKRFLRGKRKLGDPPTRLQRLGQRLGRQDLFWNSETPERAYGIIVEQFDIQVWRRVLAPFVKVEAVINNQLKIPTDLRTANLNLFWASLVGGNMNGLCLKSEGEQASADFRQRLMCLDCGSNHLTRMEEEALVCENCRRVYPCSKGVVRMFPSSLEDQLTR